MNRVIVVGSPRVNGRCAFLAEELFEACIEECPEDEISLIPLSMLTVKPCVGCNACRESEGHACPIDDDMAHIRETLDEADELTIVSPVYFAGAPATLKAFLDRLQPYFWANTRHEERLRPACLHIIGEGHDPFGFDPLITTVQSATYTAGFRLDQVINWVGRISEEGEILEDAEFLDIAWPIEMSEDTDDGFDEDAE